MDGENLKRNLLIEEEIKENTDNFQIKKQNSSND